MAKNNMAKSNNKAALFVLLLSLLLISTIAESKRVFRVGKLKADSAPRCDEVIGVESGDTCFGIAQSFALSAAQFDAINPNINCNALFVGQWICVGGSA